MNNYVDKKKCYHDFKFEVKADKENSVSSYHMTK